MLGENVSAWSRIVCMISTASFEYGLSVAAGRPEPAAPRAAAGARAGR